MSATFSNILSRFEGQTFSVQFCEVFWSATYWNLRLSRRRVSANVAEPIPKIDD
jgi:hypothetical protein